jgi:hypothetical protein
MGTPLVVRLGHADTYEGWCPIFALIDDDKALEVIPARDEENALTTLSGTVGELACEPALESAARRRSLPIRELSSQVNVGKVEALIAQSRR